MTDLRVTSAMKRYTNWTLIIIGAVLALLALSSRAWIPVVQPYWVEEETVDDFACASYVTSEDCEALRGIHAQNPEYAEAQLQAMAPENTFEVIDLEPSEIATRMRQTIGSSDDPDIITIRNGVFNPPRNPIHNATGEVRIIQIVASGQEAVETFVRLDGGTDESFQVTNGPNLHVYLSQHPDPTTPEEVMSGDRGPLDLGPLRGNSGRQNYELSLDIDPSLYGSLVIYCPEFDQIYGVAPFIEQ